MLTIGICKYCSGLEYYGNMMWLNGKCCCRKCYKTDFEKQTKMKYSWSDLDGHVPTQEEYDAQELAKAERNLKKEEDLNDWFRGKTQEAEK